MSGEKDGILAYHSLVCINRQAVKHVSILSLFLLATSLPFYVFGYYIVVVTYVEAQHRSGEPLRQRNGFLWYLHLR